MTEQKQALFLGKLENYWLIEGRDNETGRLLLKSLRNPLAPITELEFKWHLADAILNHRFTPKEYERLTGADSDTPEDIVADLSELWQLLFKDEPIAMPVL